ncbi:hypothetical protein EC2770900_5263 [Escherichia coli 2770900]|nr:hypothetical protein EC2770900_5263 [Escherichia coli 2770900]
MQYAVSVTGGRRCAAYPAALTTTGQTLLTARRAAFAWCEGKRSPLLAR